MQKWGIPEADPSDVIHPEEWLSHFKLLFNEDSETPNESIKELESCEEEPAFSELDFRISSYDIEKALKRLNKNSSPGPDKMSAKLLSAGQSELMPLLKLLFNKIFVFVAHPKIWSENYLKPIFKKGDIWDPDNFRGIAVGSSLGKIFYLILLDRLEMRTQQSNLISPNQIGFMKEHRTADHIFVLKTIIDRIVRIERKKLFVAFIDFRKAYDRVNRSLLLLKLQKLGITALFYRNLKTIYKSIVYLIKVKGGHLEPISSICGLKQGGVLSPLLFNLFIDDIKMIFDESCDPIKVLGDHITHLLYADDLILFSSTQSGLKECLAKLEQYCDKSQMEVNIKKSQVIIFNPSGQKLCGPKFYFKQQLLEIVKSYCYLGVEFTCSGTFRTAKSSLIEKSRKALFPLMSTVAQFHLPCSNAINLFNSLIKPIALYNSENWATLTFHQIAALKQQKTSLFSYMITSDIERVHQKFLKFILGVKQNCTNAAVLGELGEVPLVFHGFISLLRFWHRINCMTGKSLVKQALNVQTREDTPDSEWIATVKYLLSYLGMDNIFDNPISITTEKFSTLCKNTLRKKIEKEWVDQISGLGRTEGQTNKLRFYKTFKHDLSREPYLSVINDFQLRKNITKFRCSDHKLEIEVGRHKKLKVEERICKVCDANIVETELHFLTCCPLYEDLRIRYFGNSLKDHNEWLNTLRCKDKKTSFNLANYLIKASKRREQLLLQNL